MVAACFIRSSTLAFLAIVHSSCVLLPWQEQGGYDSRSVNIQTFNFFNQRDLPRGLKANWRGDWLFRRQRLALIDNALRASKPDIFVYQEGMEREGSPSESDEFILSAGALQGYEWQKTDIKKYDDTQELEGMGIAVGLPLKVVRREGNRSSWVLGNEGFITADVISFEDQPIVIFNVQMPPKIGRKYLWYTFIQERLADFVKKGGYCPRRVIVAGYMPTEQGANRFQSFTKALELRDTGEQFCNVANTCYTATPENELFLSLSDSGVSGHVDKILVHRDAIIFSGGRNLNTPAKAGPYIQKYGFGKLWPSKRYGWVASVRLPRCAPTSQESVVDR